ncbi:MAG: DUF2142 domain-containing protein [Methanobacterium paludis]|nr:DUF2142 domain-containing protein [Methanobacterium paludis]
MIVTPPFQVADESTHYYKVLGLTDGQLLPEKQGDATGFYVPKSAVETFGAFQNLNPENKITMGYTLSLMDLPLQTNYKTFKDLSDVAIASYPPFPYLASASTIFLGKIFNFSPLVLLYFGSFVNLILYVLIVYMAIKITPVHKWVFLLLALMPMTLFQAASISADSFTIAISFLIIAYFFKFAFDDNKKDFNIRDFCILGVLFIILALSKQVYCLLILLFFMLPSSKFGGWKKKFLKFVYICFPVVIIIIFWKFLISGLYNPPEAKFQLLFVLSNPTAFPNVLLNSILSSFNNYLVMFVGDLGWLDTPLPQWLVYSYSIILILTSLLDKNDIKINLKQKIIPLITFALIFVSIFFLEYVTWTPVANSMVVGVQGRYFIPFAPLLLLLFYNNRIKISGNERSILNWIIILTVFITLLITTFIIIKRYYII